MPFMWCNAKSKIFYRNAEQISQHFTDVLEAGGSIKQTDCICLNYYKRHAECIRTLGSEQEQNSSVLLHMIGNLRW